MHTYIHTYMKNDRTMARSEALRCIRDHRDFKHVKNHIYIHTYLHTYIHTYIVTYTHAYFIKNLHIYYLHFFLARFFCHAVFRFTSRAHARALTRIFRSRAYHAHEIASSWDVTVHSPSSPRARGRGQSKRYGPWHVTTCSKAHSRLLRNLLNGWCQPRSHCAPRSWPSANIESKSCTTCLGPFVLRKPACARTLICQ